MIEDMPPGFRFYPTEAELVSFYLHHKLQGTRDDLNRLMDRVIPVVNIYQYNPWDLPQFSEFLCHKDPEQWFFFIPRRESEARGGRPNRLTTTGYWKATGSPSFVFCSNRPVGEKRTMVFYNGRAPNGNKTDWKMNEYKALVVDSGDASSSTVMRQELSVCRVYKKSKCLRAFDRRPEAGVVIDEEASKLMYSAHYPPQIFTSSSVEESSTSGLLSHHHIADECSDNNDTRVNIEPSWDLDQLDRFCGIP